MQRITLDSKALFDFDKADLKPEGKAAIDSQIVGKIAQVQKLEVVLVTGHTDRLGSEAYNQKLSERRANTVRDYLVSKGVDKVEDRDHRHGRKAAGRAVQPEGQEGIDRMSGAEPSRRSSDEGRDDEVEDSQVQTRKAPLARGFFSRRSDMANVVPGAIHSAFVFVSWRC